MKFLVRFSQTHESFRIPELRALSIVENVTLNIVEYSDTTPFCIVDIPSVSDAQRLIQRSLLTQSIHEYWGSGNSLAELLDVVREGHYETKRPELHLASFRFNFDSFRGTRKGSERGSIIDQFSFLAFEGPIIMKDPQEVYTVFEEWAFPVREKDPRRLHFGRLVGHGSRQLSDVYDLKKRAYISTTSMDAELSLVTANIALASPGKLFYDPFVGTGSFAVAVAHFGAMALGSDIDGRSIRGDGGRKCVKGNFEQYHLEAQWGDMFSADLTNTPIRVTTKHRLLDGIVCDPPYGVREGLRVLGSRESKKPPKLFDMEKIKEIEAQEQRPWCPATKPYSFFGMLDDILDFAATTLVDHGRLAFWMPASNEQQELYTLPSHPCLEKVSLSTQAFNHWSRHLICYRRTPDADVDESLLQAYREARDKRKEKPKASNSAESREDIKDSADDLNPFRKSYFSKKI